MSRHLNTVATSTLHKKQAQHQLARRKLSRQDQVVATTFVLRSCRDKIRLSRQHLYWEDVTTRLGCRDNHCPEKTSRQDEAVTTTITQRRRRDKIRLSRQQMHFKLVAAIRQAIRQAMRQAIRQVATRTATRAATSTATRPTTGCDNICILGQFAKVQQEMPPN